MSLESQTVNHAWNPVYLLTSHIFYLETYFCCILYNRNNSFIRLFAYTHKAFLNFEFYRCQIFEATALRKPQPITIISALWLRVQQNRHITQPPSLLKAKD